MGDRRQFLRNATTGLAAYAALGVVPEDELISGTEEWDLGWPSRLKGKRRAIFDAADIESGFGVFRASVWASQCVEVLGAQPEDVSPVVVVRAHAVILALKQSFWDEYDVGRLRKVTHPVSLKETTRNPVLMDVGDGLPLPLASAGLAKQLARGVTVLVCNLALQPWVDVVRGRGRASETEARAVVVSALVPGVILQPSGVLAAVLAQEHGCAYIRAS